jgi:predicted Rossmann fold nucleotide-binding protein DprA/Smf involved in DNA uptake
VAELGFGLPAKNDAEAEASGNGSTSSEDPVLTRMDAACAYDLDELAGACGLETPRLLTHLADLELRGLIRRVEGGRFIRQ